MMYRMFPLMALALAMFVGGPLLAVEDVKDAAHDGKLVSITGDQLVMTAGKEGKEHTHTLARDAKLTLDGKACKVADLKAGTKIRVTVQGADKQLAVRIEGIDKNPDFAASHRHDGKVVSRAAPESSSQERSAGPTPSRTSPISPASVTWRPTATTRP
jgi:hypothetical protein